MSTPANEERRRLADELAAAGPDADTLCEGWTTRDLAAHIVLRDTRPDAAPGVVMSTFAGYTENIQGKIAGRDWDDLVEQVRSGPPRWSPTRIGRVERAINTIEFFVHLEDVRRAQDGWEPRELDPALIADLDAGLRRGAKLIARKAPVGVTLDPGDGSDPIVANRGEPMVTVSGPIGELVLFLYGRQDHARVELIGGDDDIDQLRNASFGL